MATKKEKKPKDISSIHFTILSMYAVIVQICIINTLTYEPCNQFKHNINIINYPVQFLKTNKKLAKTFSNIKNNL
jgi:hypothetical protein